VLHCFFFIQIVSQQCFFNCVQRERIFFPNLLHQQAKLYQKILTVSELLASKNESFKWEAHLVQLSGENSKLMSRLKTLEMVIKALPTYIFEHFGSSNQQEESRLCLQRTCLVWLPYGYSDYDHPKCKSEFKLTSIWVGFIYSYQVRPSYPFLIFFVLQAMFLLWWWRLTA